MNRYLIEGLLDDLRLGKQIALVASSRRAAQFAFSEFVKEVEPERMKVRRASGSESITHDSGGQLKLYALNSGSLRGLAPDMLVVVDGLAMSPEMMETLFVEVQVMKTSGTLEVIR